VEAAVTEAPAPGHAANVSSAEAIAVPAQSRPSLEPLEVSVPKVEARAQSFRAMYDGHVDFVWRNLRRMGVLESEVDDRTQEVFLVAHRRFDEFHDRGHGSRAWLFQIVLRVASDARRHHRRRP
jgi:DNA-directed RNA polymerase specialized sigma24 family protein